MQSLRLKICCISSVAEADDAIEAGADAIGLVSAMPSGPGVIDEALIAEICAHVGDRAETFLLTSKTDADAIIEQCVRLQPSTVQLVDAVDSSVYARLGQVLPALKIVQVLHVIDVDVIDVARELDGVVDFILLDSGNPSATVKQLGGTGRTHNWEISARLIEAVNTPVFLAGGLRAENAAEAVAAVNPYGLDICSGVRTDGALDLAKLRAYMQAARGA
ncbi:MAG: N-(5'-phosphoribosyl)anthranilate isomerase [Gammaproteobacteria bacterium]|nr:N-(5'-phosphoribosyl)anthranilate isomerase [Gammaproteobacteria bacterium]